MQKVAYHKVWLMIVLITSVSTGILYATSTSEDKKKEKTLPWGKVLLGGGAALLAVKYLSSRTLVESPEESNSSDFHFVSSSWFAAGQQPLMNLGRAASGQIKAAIVPHAGLQYSGSVAAAALEKVDWKQYDTFLLLSTSHKSGQNYQLPQDIQTLTLPSSTGSVDILPMQELNFLADKAKLEKEHSWQVLLPFIDEINTYLTAHEQQPLKFIPLLIGKELTSQELTNLHKCLQAHPKTFLCVNTDLLHRPNTNRKDIYTWDAFDQVTIEQIKKAVTDGTALEREKDGKHTMCGIFAMQAFIQLAHRLQLTPDGEAAYRNSFDATKEATGKYVGYLGMAFKSNVTSAPPTVQSKNSDTPVKELPTKVLEDNKGVLGKRIDKEQIESIAKNYEKDDDQPIHGLFVTINKGQTQTLRGCMGTFSAIRHGLRYWAARQTLTSALHDGRFPPITQDELTNLSFEISVLEEPFSIYKKGDSQTPFEAFKGAYKDKDYGITIEFDDNNGATYLPSVLQREKDTLEQLFNNTVTGLRKKSDPERFRGAARLEQTGKEDYTTEIQEIKLYLAKTLR